MKPFASVKGQKKKVHGAKLILHTVDIVLHFEINLLNKISGHDSFDILM